MARGTDEKTEGEEGREQEGYAWERLDGRREGWRGEERAGRGGEGEWKGRGISPPQLFLKVGAYGL